MKGIFFSFFGKTQTESCIIRPRKSQSK